MKKIALLILVLVMALGTLGVAYARWSQTVAISGTVKSGNFAVALVSQKSNDPGTHGSASGGVASYLAGNLDPQGHVPLGNGSWGGLFYNNTTPNDPSNWFWSGTLLDKNVASANCNITTNTLTYAIDNGYPGYGPDVAFAVQNNGTIPAKIASIAVTSITTPNGTYTVNIPVDAVNNNTVYMFNNTGGVTTFAGPFNAGYDDNYAFSMVITSLSGIPLTGVQIDPGNGVWGDVGFHFGESAIQGANNYSVTLTYTFAQWNEVP